MFLPLAHILYLGQCSHAQVPRFLGKILVNRQIISKWNELLKVKIFMEEDYMFLHLTKLKSAVNMVYTLTKWEKKDKNT